MASDAQIAAWRRRLDRERRRLVATQRTIAQLEARIAEAQSKRDRHGRP